MADPSARATRERLKENQIAVRASFLEKNSALRQEVADLRRELGKCKNILAVRGPARRPCRRAAGGSGPDRPSPQRPTFLTSALYQTQQRRTHVFGVCVLVLVLLCGQRCVCVCSRVVSAVRVCACARLLWSEM